MEEKLLRKIVALDKTFMGTTDPYNIFSVLSIETKEVLICRVIGDLLNPRGAHGENSKFLSLFLKEIPELQYIAGKPLDQAIVTTEYVIDENRRIDIVIEIDGHFVPVEVKIFAGEQKAQCLDYYQFARQRDQTAKVVYLTRFGTMPGTYSCRSGEACVLEKDIICISFQNTVLQWLTACWRVSHGRTKMVVEQLRESVEHMTGATEEKTMQAVAKEIGKSADSLRAAIQISDSLKDAKTKLILQVMKEFERQMVPLKEKYHLKEEAQTGWYGYEKQVEQFYDHAYSTYPGINYVVTNIPAFRTYQLWFRIEIDNRLFAGFCLFDPTADSPEGKGNQVDDYDADTRTWIEQILKVSKSDQSAWWAVWRYLPTGSTQSSKEVPDFRAMNDAAVSLADEQVRNAFVANAIKQIEQTLFSLLK